MGLDMYAIRISKKPKSPVDFDSKDGEEIHYWRKHPNLHGWMESLYRQKGGKEATFNCVNLELTLQDLDRLEAEIKARKLPQTKGFFFGESELDESEMKDDLDFVKKAKEIIQAGEHVFYTSWW
jgi:hypothetical protein